MTYTVVANDARGAVGLATCSHSMFLASKTVHVSAFGETPRVVVSQAFSSPKLGTAALASLRDGLSPRDALNAAMSSDSRHQLRQLLVANQDGVAARTGEACVAVAGEVISDDGRAAVAGNMLESDAVMPAIVDAFDSADGPLADRLVAALQAGHASGGDYRGDRSAAIVVFETNGYGPRLTVDEHEDPTGELSRLLDLHRADTAVRRCMAWWLAPASPPPAGLEDEVRRVRPLLGDTGQVWLELIAFAIGNPLTTQHLPRRMQRSIRDLLAVRPSDSKGPTS